MKKGYVFRLKTVTLEKKTAYYFCVLSYYLTKRVAGLSLVKNIFCF